ncbi:MAG: YfdX family protein [Aquificae bacterium]|nr:YfdX family protein [Aquificota bacterium]
MFKKTALAMAAIFGFVAAPLSAQEATQTNTVSIQSEQQNIYNKSAQQLIKGATKEALKNLRQEELAKIIKEAAEVVQLTRQALLLLAQNQVEKALSVLQKAETLMAKLLKEYQVKRVPVDVAIIEFNGVTDLKVAQKLNKQVKELVSKNDFVDARFILALLRDEIDITTTYMPLAAYAEAIKFAKQLLQANKVQAAILVLQSALNTLEVETVIVPKPILEAQMLVSYAKQLFRVKPDIATKLLERAKYDIELAKALGYVSSEKDIEPLIEEINALEEAIKNGAATTEEQFNQLQQNIQKFKENNIKVQTQ